MDSRGFISLGIFNVNWKENIMNLGAEEIVPAGSSKGDTFNAIGSAAGAFFQALGYGDSTPTTSAPFNWTPVFILGGIAIGGLVLFGAMGNKRRRR